MDMDKKNYLELLDRFLMGLTDETEEKMLRKWMRQTGSKEICSQYYKDQWDAANTTMDADVQARMFSDIMEKVDKLEKQQPAKRKYRLPAWVCYAAVACILFAVAFGTYHCTRSSLFSDKEFVVFAERGQKANIVLPDGTQVWLNSDTRLSYRNSYNAKNRTLFLEGEAFFKVVKNKDKPFVVVANDVEIEALGTQFNVKAYGDDKLVSVVLTEGSVRVNSKEMSALLTPNTCLIYDKETRNMSHSIVQAEDYALWRKGEICYNGERFEDIAKDLSRAFHVNILIESEQFKNKRFTGYIGNSSLKNILDILTVASTMEYSVENDSIYIYDKKQHKK